MTTKALLLATWERRLALLGATVIAALLSSCAQLHLPKPTAPEPEPEPPVAQKKPPPEPIKPPPPSRLYEWHGSKDYVSRIEISVDEQKARFYSGDNEVGWTTVASGVHRHPTPVGSFAVLEKVQNKRSNLYGRIYNKNGRLVKRNAKMGVDSVPKGGRFKGASMPYFLRITHDGIGMHAGPIPRPGHRASHGCIRMPRKFAPILYRYVDVGTPVVIKGQGPSYASYAAKHRSSAPKSAPAAVAQADTTQPAASKPQSGMADDSAREAVATTPETTAPASQPTPVDVPVVATASAPVPTAVGTTDDVPPHLTSQPAQPESPKGGVAGHTPAWVGSPVSPPPSPLQGPAGSGRQPTADRPTVADMPAARQSDGDSVPVAPTVSSAASTTAEPAVSDSPSHPVTESAVSSGPLEAQTPVSVSADETKVSPDPSKQAHKEQQPVPVEMASPEAVAAERTQSDDG
jgi:hypothetical protein